MDVFKNFHLIPEVATREAVSSLAVRLEMIEERLDFMVDKFKEIEEKLLNEQVDKPLTSRPKVNKKVPANKRVDI